MTNFKYLNVINQQFMLKKNFNFCFVIYYICVVYILNNSINLNYIIIIYAKVFIKNKWKSLIELVLLLFFIKIINTETN